MADINEVKKNLASMDLVAVSPKSRDSWIPAAVFNPTVGTYTKNDEARPSRMNALLNKINAAPLMTSALEGAMLSNFHTPNNSESQAAISHFRSFMSDRKSPYVTFDIETLGDKDLNGGRSLAVTEIAAQGFVKGKPNAYNKFNVLIRPDDVAHSEIRGMINRIKQDPFAYRSMTRSEQVTLANLLRYSTSTAGGVTGAVLEQNKGGMFNIVHNSVINSVLRMDGSIDSDKIISNLPFYTAHMEQGLEGLMSRGLKSNEAIGSYNQFLGKNAGNYFFSFNGANFDIPALQQWAGKVGTPIQDPAKHIDYMRVLKTIYPDNLQMHADFNRPADLAFNEGTGTQNEIKRSFGIKVDGAHAGNVDASALGDVIEKSSGIVYNKIESAKGSAFDSVLKEIRSRIKNDRTYDHVYKALSNNQETFMALESGEQVANFLRQSGIKNEKMIGAIVRSVQASQLGFQHKPTEFSWMDETIKPGMTLFANGGYYGANGLDFQAELVDGKFAGYQTDFNKTAINSKSFYEVKGIRDVSETDEAGAIKRKRLALELHDQALGRTSFIVREGDNAMDQLTQFVQQRFYNWNGLSKNDRHSIALAKEVDQARRRYERMFSLQGAGSRSTTSGFEAAQRLYGNIGAYKQRVYGKFSALPAGVSPSEYGRIAHQEMLGMMNFANAEEQRTFFRMAPRMLSEHDHFSAAIKSIEQQFQIRDGMSEEEVKRIRQQRDIAWRMYAQSVDEEAGQHRENRPLQPYENRGVRFMDRISREEKYLNFESFESATSSVWRMLGSKTEKESVRRERMTSLLASLQHSGVIDETTAGSVSQRMANYKLNDAVTDLVMRMMDSDAIIQRTIEVNSMKRRRAVESLSVEQNQALISRSITQASGIRGFIMKNGVSFDGEISSLFNQLDQRHITGLNPNNRAAVEHILQAYQGKGLHTALSLNAEGTQAKVTLFKPKNSHSVLEAVLAGQAHKSAVELVVPLINERGTHVIGNQEINARSFLVNENGAAKTISSVESIARAYTDSRTMREITKAIDDGNYDTKAGSRALRRELNTLSGVKRDYGGANDTYYMQRNISDLNKQGHVSVAPAMIEDYYRKGSLDLKDINEEMYSVDQNGNVTFSRHIDFRDVTPRKSWEMIHSMDRWMNEYQLYAGSNKAEMVARGIWNMNDIREINTYGHYTFQGRDNSTQWLNAYKITDDVEANLGAKAAEGNVYINMNPLVTTERAEQWKKEVEKRSSLTERTDINIKTKYMTQTELENRMNEITKTHGAELEKIGLMKNGKLDKLMMPRLYEQQMVISKELDDVLKVKTEKFLDKADQGDLHSTFEWSKGFYDQKTDQLIKTTVNPGDVLGYRTVNGNRRAVTYEHNRPGQIFTAAGENRIGIQIEEDPFKFMIEGEKGTKSNPIPQWLMDLIAGEKGVGAIYNPNIVKHKDYGMWLTGKAKLVADHLMSMGKEERAKALAAAEQELAAVGLMWKGDRFHVTAKGEQIAADAFDRVFKKVGLQADDSIAIQSLRMSQVSNYSRMSDETGRVVLGYTEDGKKILGEEKGVSWGHREYKVLDHMGLEITKQKVFDRMMEGAEESFRKAELDNMRRALGSFVYDHETAGVGSRESSIGLNDKRLNGLPEHDRFGYYDKAGDLQGTYKGTIFDRKHMEKLLGQEGGHGFWLELPEVADYDAQGNKTSHPYSFVESVQRTNGVNKEIRKNLTDNKIFIPFTQVEPMDNGQIHLREIQQHIASIYRRAEEVKQAGSKAEAVHAHGRLQTAIDDYTKRLSYDMTSSQGQAGKSVVKASMQSSGSGIFKLMPIQDSIDLADEFTYISVADAEKLGVAQALRDGKELMTMNVRYPTFHNDAMQITKLRMHEGIQPGEFHTTALASSFMRADSDGDYDHIVALTDEDVQTEWRRRYEQEKQQRVKRLQAAGYGDVVSQSLGKDMKEDAERSFTSRGVLGDEAVDFRGFRPNDGQEVSAKAGKMVIGHASNLNYKMNQLASQFLQHDKEGRQAIHDFGAALEQKLISSKHDNAADAINHSTPHALNFISALQRGDWKSAQRIDEQFFDNMFSQKYSMDRAINALNGIQDQMADGLYNPSLGYGTSSGVDTSRVGVSAVADQLYGRTESNQASTSNTFRQLVNTMNDQGMGAESPEHEPYKLDPYQTTEPKLKKVRGTGAATQIAETIHDGLGGMYRDASEAIEGTLNKFFKGEANRGNRRAALLSGLALGGVMGYNYLSDDEPVVPLYNGAPSEFADGSPGYSYQSPVPAISPLQGSGGSGASIQVSASGRGADPQNMPSLVQQGMSNANYTGGKVAMTVNHSDNTSSLTRQWYRDKVAEHM